MSLSGIHHATRPRRDATNRLERRYRLLLLAYPSIYREAKGDEIVATLLDNAGSGRSMPSIADVADILGHALRRRVSGELEHASQLAAPWALALAAGVAAFVWWQVEPVIPTTGPIAYAAWILATAGAVLLPHQARRPFIAVALAATVATMLVAPLMHLQRPPVWIVMSLLGLGLIAITNRARLTIEQRANITAAAAAIVVACEAISPTITGYYQPIIARIGAVIAIGVLATAVVAFHRKLRGRSPKQALLAGLVLALPATWLGPIDSIAWEFPVDNLTAARFGRLAHVIVATCAVLCLLALMNHTRPIKDSRMSGAVLGSALGYGIFAAFVAWPGHVTAAVAALGATAFLLRARPTIPTLVGSAAATLLGCWLVGVYSNDWTHVGWNDPNRTVVLASMLTIVPCSLAVLSGLRNRSSAALPSGIWIAYLTLPALLAWGPLLWALAGAAVVGATRKAIVSR